MKKLMGIVGLMVLALLPLHPQVIAQAQGETSNPTILTPGENVSASLSQENPAASFVFLGSAGDVVFLDAFTDDESSSGLTLLMYLIAPNGEIVAQEVDVVVSPTDATISDYELPQSGQYTVLVTRGNVATSAASGQFTLSLTGSLSTPETDTSAPAPTTTTETPSTTEAADDSSADVTDEAPTQISLTESGIEIGLVWSAAVNLDLEVRDPVGNAIYSTNPSAPNGGALVADVNATCETATADSPTEIISWPQGIVPIGSYEIIIYYVDGCSVGGPQQFNITAQINGGDQQSVPGILNPGQSYLAAVELAANGDWVLLNGGVNAGLDVSLLSTQISQSQPFPGVQALGTINRANPAFAYTFEGVANDVVNITMDALTGSLDTYLILLGPDGGEVARNDDREGSTNSQITTRIIQSGIYTIVATRYGQTIGGTEGDFVLNFSLSIGDLADPSGLDLPAAPTDTDSAIVSTDSDLSTTEGVQSGIVTGGESTNRPAGLPSGSIEVILTWNSIADVQLLVRDPEGVAIYDDNTTSPTGGIQLEEGNARCESTPTPVGYIYWPQGRRPAGLYEIDVWFQDPCEGAETVTYTLLVNVDGVEIINTTQTAVFNSHYATTFQVSPDGTATAYEGGFFSMSDASSINYFALLSTADRINYGETITGNITVDERYQLYSFEGQTGDRVRISMQRTSGTLDTALFLISPEGIQIAFNDDIVDPVTFERSTNSLIESVTLPTTGTYYIIATHYALEFGGTIGTYTLTLFQLPPG